MTLVEVAVLHGFRLRSPVEDILDALSVAADFHIVPVDVDIAAEVAAKGDALRDPGDRVIVATARVHRFRLVTSDRRIIESKLVSAIE
jgi:PIN domain nuclease of toxin-antitoxin system